MFRIYSFLAHTQFRKVYKTITQQHPIIVFLYYRVQSQDAICDFEVIQLLLILFALSTKVCYSKWNTSIYNYFLYIWLRYVHRLSLTLPILTLTLFLSLHVFIFSRISKSKSLVVLASKDHESECYGNSLQTFGAFEIYENDVWTWYPSKFYGPRISILLTSFIHMTTSMNLRKHFSFILFDSVNFSDLHGAFLYA